MPCVKWFPINPLRLLVSFFLMHQHQIKTHIEKVLLPFVVVKEIWCGLYITFSLRQHLQIHRCTGLVCEIIFARDRCVCGKRFSRQRGRASEVRVCAFGCRACAHFSCVWISYGREDQSPFELLRVYFSPEWHKFILLLSVISYE